MCDSVCVCVGAYFIYIIYMIPRYILWSQEKYKEIKRHKKINYVNSLIIHTKKIMTSDDKQNK